MRRPATARASAAVVVALVVLTTTACAGPSASGPSASGPSTSGPSTTPAVDAIRVGPGTQVVYHVEPQPAPGSCHYSWVGADPLPDPACTPGAVNPAVTQADIGSTICRPGWTATVRPPEAVTGPEKVASAAAYGFTGSFTTAEYDHLIPLELGGDPDDAANLWVEPNDDPDATTTHNSKDDLEDVLRAQVCAGRLSLATAQAAIASDWVVAAARYGG